ncbi:ABC transporter permease [Fulvivirga sp. RKSG066]|uniref:ABC transporter permease n=1 Tax=Fulvivirga aurantia TaxID=2529383 RepID=UPI0012BD701B|nr:ABC transporter permease [Fulvivirga aurantia]MTI22945.1 ABC transporter permease [Fulvivirga aurantia]
MNNQVQPPRAAVRLFRWYCNDALVEDMLGDLEEIFDNNLSKMPRWKAQLKYWIQIIDLITSYSVKKRKNDSAFHLLSNTQNSTTMFKNYFKVAYRSLLKQKLFTAINVIGIALGLSISLLMIAVISDILEYDKFQKNRDSIYRIITKTYDKESVEHWATSPAPAAELVSEFSEIKHIVKMNNQLEGEVHYNGKYIPMYGFFVDPAFLDVFSFELIKGDLSTALSQPNNILITESESIKLFSEEDPLGKVVSIEPYGEFVVTGVLKDHPKKSHIHFDIIGSYQKYTQLEQQQILPKLSTKWDHLEDHYTYIQLKDGSTPDNLINGIAQISKNKQANSPNIEVNMELQAMSDITLGKELNRSLGPQWDTISMIVFGVMALFILIPACFNYANISMARALKRAKEIGVRKVVGGQKQQIFLQFIVETMLVCLISFALSYVLFTYLRVEFMEFLAPASAAGLSLEITPLMIGSFIAFTLFTGFLIGIIPALHFAKMKPLNALKNKLPTRVSGKFNMKKALMVVQFTLSLGFIMAVAIMLDQYRYSLNHKMGFEQENVLNVKLHDAKYEQLKTEASKLSEVTAISFSSTIVGVRSHNFTWIKQSDHGDSSQVFQIFADQNYLDLHEIQLLAGKNFPSEMPKQESYVIVNEEFVASLGYENNNDALGKTVILENGTEVSIIGVVQNFHYTDIRNEIKPMFFRYDPSQFAYANLKLNTPDVFSTIDKLEDEYEKLSEREFQATFLSSDINDVYVWYHYFVKMVGFLGFLAITISCLGLLGMVVFNVESRTKEVGIRKVHGASVKKIAFILSKEYISMAALSVIIAVPLTYALFDFMLPYMQHYNAGVSIGAVFLSILFLLVMVGLTISSQTVKAAKANPADTLKYE